MTFVLHAFVSLLLSHSPCHASGLSDTGFQVVVNRSNPVSTIDAKLLADIFLKKRTLWPDRNVILVVDLEATSDVRRQFSERILDRPVSAVRNYWQQLLFSGRGVPPPEFGNEQEVLNFIASHPEAIGYVSGNAPIGSLKNIDVR